MTSLFKAMQQLEQGLLRKQATLQEVMPGAQPMQTSVEPVKDRDSEKLWDMLQKGLKR